MEAQPLHVVDDHAHAKVHYGPGTPPDTSDNANHVSFDYDAYGPYTAPVCLELMRGFYMDLFPALAASWIHEYGANAPDWSDQVRDVMMDAANRGDMATIYYMFRERFINDVRECLQRISYKTMASAYGSECAERMAEYANIARGDLIWQEHDIDMIKQNFPFPEDQEQQQ
jgi:hypothetical protein